MKIKIKEKEHIDLLTKITFILLGVLTTSVVYGVLNKHLATLGVYIATALLTTLSAILFKKSKPKSKIRLVAWGIIITTLLLIIAAISILAIIKISLNKAI